MTSTTLKKANEIEHQISSLKDFQSGIFNIQWLTINQNMVSPKTLSVKYLGEDNLQVLKNSLDDLITERIESLEAELKAL
jgi:hypothetical protein